MTQKAAFARSLWRPLWALIGALLLAIWAGGVGAPVHAIAIQCLCSACASAFILLRPGRPAPLSQPSPRADSYPLPQTRPIP